MSESEENKVGNKPIKPVFDDNVRNKPPVFDNKAIRPNFDNKFANKTTRPIFNNKVGNQFVNKTPRADMDNKVNKVDHINQETGVESTVENNVESKENNVGNRFGNRATRPDFRKTRTGFNKNFKPRERRPEFDDSLKKEILLIGPVSKTRTGGRIRSMRVMLVLGDGEGKIGLGCAKARNKIDAERKAIRRAKKNLMTFPLFQNRTISHNVTVYHCGISMKLIQAREGTGLLAGGITRKMFTVAGVKEIVCKIDGNSTSEHNMAYTVMKGLAKLRTVKEIATRLNQKPYKILERKFS